jgi:hypothetical protein
MLNLSKKLLIATTLTLGMASYSHADLVLDTFDYTPDVNILVDSGNPTDSAQRNNINALGDDVIYDLTYQAGSGSLNSSSVSFDNFGDGVMAWSNDSSMISTLLLTYSRLPATGAPSDPTGPIYGTSDLSAFDGFYYDVVDSDLNFSILVTIGSSAGTSTFNENSSSIIVPTRKFIDFSAFAANTGPGADLSLITYISLELSSVNASADLTLSQIGVTNVPEPASLAIFGFGLIGLALSARKKV